MDCNPLCMDCPDQWVGGALACQQCRKKVDAEKGKTLSGNENQENQDEKGDCEQMSEHQEQAALIEMCKLHERKYPGLELIHAIPNGGRRHIAVAAKLKAEGVKAGVPDIFLPVPKGNAHGLYIELKAKGGKVSEAQYDMMSALAAQGYACIVAYGWKKAWAEIEKYMRSETVQIWTLGEGSR